MNKLKKVINVIDNVRAKDIVCYDMKGFSPFYSYNIICTGNSDRQVFAIMDHLKGMAIENDYSIRVEGKEGGSWLLVDLEDIIVNIFIQEQRDYFNLEKLWLDIPKIDVESLIDV